MCQYQYVRLFWDIFLALLEKNYKLCCWVLRGSVENSSWGQLLPISRAMSNYEGGATQAALLPHVTPATPSGCCGQQPNAVSCFLRLTWEWMGVTVLGVYSESKALPLQTPVVHPLVSSKNKENDCATHQNKGGWVQMKAFSTKWLDLQPLTTPLKHFYGAKWKIVQWLEMLLVWHF